MTRPREVKKLRSRYLLVVSLCAALPKTPGGSNRKRIDSICQYVQDNYVSDLSLSVIAKEHRISPSYLSLLFAQETGKKFSDYLTECRIRKAMEILKHTDKRVCEIATEVGYKDPYYFSNRFKKFTGLWPTEYRERVGK